MKKFKKLMMSSTALSVILILSAVLGAGHKWW